MQTVKQAFAAPVDNNTDEIILSLFSLRYHRWIGYHGLTLQKSISKDSVLIPMHEIWVTAEQCMLFSTSRKYTAGE